MQGDADMRSRRTRRVAAVALGGRGERLARCRERRAACLGRGAVAQAAEDRQHTVAHYFHDFAAMLAHGRDHVVEIVVQHPHHGARRHRVG